MATPDGIEVCRRLRAEDNAPIIMLADRDDVADKVAASDLGPLPPRQERPTARRRRARTGQCKQVAELHGGRISVESGWVAEPKLPSSFC